MIRQRQHQQYVLKRKYLTATPHNCGFLRAAKIFLEQLLQEVIKMLLLCLKCTFVRLVACNDSKNAEIIFVKFYAENCTKIYDATLPKYAG